MILDVPLAELSPNQIVLSLAHLSQHPKTFRPIALGPVLVLPQLVVRSSRTVPAYLNRHD